MSISIIVFTVFITLKLIGISPVVYWGWWIVFSPLWVFGLMQAFYIIVRNILEWIWEREGV